VTSVTRKSRASRSDRRREVTATLGEHVERLLQNESWTSLSIERLCAESGVARSTFYLFFEDQGHLLTVLADEALHGIIDAGEPWWTLGRDAERAELVAAVDAVFGEYERHSTLLTAVVEAASYDARVREQFDALMERSIAAVTDHIVQGQAEGWVNPTLSADAIAHWISWMGESGLRATAQRGERPRGKMLDAFVGIVWNVLYHRDR
jgi:AcrR family transcriptional regulator